MKKYLVPILSMAVLVAVTGASYASADAYTYHVSQQDGTNNPTTTDVTPSVYVDSLMGNDITNHTPAFYTTDNVSLVFDDIHHNLSIGTIQTSQVADLDSDLSTIGSRLDGDDSSLSSLSSSVSSNINSISSLNSFKTKFASSSAVTEYVNDVSTSTMKRLLYNGTTVSGVTTFYLTSDGMSGGPALCPTAINQVNIIANDPSNTFGLGWTLTNSNKTLTVTVNARSFSATTILGIPVLGSSSITAASDGTPIMASIDCN